MAKMAQKNKTTTVGKKEKKSQKARQAQPKKAGQAIAIRPIMPKKGKAKIAAVKKGAAGQMGMPKPSSAKKSAAASQQAAAELALQSLKLQQEGAKCEMEVQNAAAPLAALLAVKEVDSLAAEGLNYLFAARMSSRGMLMEGAAYGAAENDEKRKACLERIANYRKDYASQRKTLEMLFGIVKAYLALATAKGSESCGAGREIIVAEWENEKMGFRSAGIRNEKFLKFVADVNALDAKDAKFPERVHEFAEKYVAKTNS